jgi:hypothetical protein
MSAPVISIAQATRSRISKNSGLSTSTIEFTSDQDLIAWEARADGSGVGEGLLVGQSESAAVETVIQHIFGRLVFGRSIFKKGVSVSPPVILTADTVASFEVDASELTNGDKTYRITVYGQNKSRVWSGYVI